MPTCVRSVAGVLVGLAFAGSAEGQKITVGPEIVGASASEVKVGFTLDAAAPVQLVTWTTDPATPVIQTNSGQNHYTFALPTSAIEHYQVVILDASNKEAYRSQVFSDSAYGVIQGTVRRANFLSTNVTDGDRLQIQADVVDVLNMSVSWTPPGTKVGSVAVPVSLHNGVDVYTVDLQHPDAIPDPRSYPVTIRADNGSQLVAMVATVPHKNVGTVGPSGGATINATAKKVTFDELLTGTATTATYHLKLTSPTGFVLDKVAPCGGATHCSFTVDDLVPGTTYTYELQFGPTATGPWTAYTNASGNKFTMDPLAKITAGPSVKLTKTGLVLTFQTDKAVDSELTWPVPASTGGTTPTIGRQSDTGTTNHVFNVTGTLAFAQTGSTLQAPLRLKVTDPAAAMVIMDLPLVMGSDFGGTTVDLGKKLKDVVDTWGPVAKGLLNIVKP